MLKLKILTYGVSVGVSGFEGGSGRLISVGVAILITLLAYRDDCDVAALRILMKLDECEVSVRTSGMPLQGWCLPIKRQ